MPSRCRFLAIQLPIAFRACHPHLSHPNPYQGALQQADTGRYHDLPNGHRFGNCQFTYAEVLLPGG
jgi:hypothetical protein